MAEYCLLNSRPLYSQQEAFFVRVHCHPRLVGKPRVDPLAHSPECRRLLHQLFSWPSLRRGALVGYEYW